MKLKKNKLIFAAAVIIGAILLFLLITEPNHGRNWTIPLIDGMVIQADPPAKKLLKYMEEKYDEEFIQVYVEPNNYSDERRHHDWGSTLWGFYHNGITVSTKDSDEYYHVRDDYGTYLDNYGCYLVNEEAEQILYDKISSVVINAKVSCFPMDMQYDELPADMTAEEYLDKAGYWLCIVICGNGASAQWDYQKICDVLDIKSGEGWMTIHYLDEDVYNDIDMENRYSILSNENYNKKLQFEVRTGEPMFVAPETEN